MVEQRLIYDLMSWKSFYQLNVKCEEIYEARCGKCFGIIIRTDLSRVDQ